MASQLFISHVSEEREIAEALKKHLEEDFEPLKVFVSTVSISAGEDWLKGLKKALEEARVELVLCSRVSVTRPWVNFEAGAGWIRRNIRMIPVCHSGIKPVDLPVPLNSLQGVVATDEKGLLDLYDSVAEAFGKQRPQPKSTFKVIAEEIGKLAGATTGPRVLDLMRDHMSAEGDADLLLHTFLGQDRDPIALVGEAEPSDRTTVFRLWTDAEYGNSIHASLGESDGVKLIRIRFTNERGSLPGDVTIRPCGSRAIAVSKRKDSSLVFDVRAPQLGQGNADGNEPLAIAARVVDARATQWSYQRRDVRVMFDIPVSDRWCPIVLNLNSNDWVRFDGDGNYYYAVDRPDFSVIAAIVIEVGTKGAVRPGPGSGVLEISRIRLSTSAPAHG